MLAPRHPLADQSKAVQPVSASPVLALKCQIALDVLAVFEIYSQARTADLEAPTLIWTPIVYASSAVAAIAAAVPTAS